MRLARLPDSAGPVIDLLFASSGIEQEIVTEAEALELLPQFTIRVATIGHLIALKVLSRDDLKRPQDLGDLRSLLRVASDTELLRARHALDLIAERGYQRGRNLASEFESLFAPPPQIDSHAMRPYGGDRDRGVVAYESGVDWIRCQFRDGSIYLYNSTQPGPHHVERMKELADAGTGLTTYINQHVRGNYARQER